MKLCPKCGRSYTDDIYFCLEDGLPLSEQEFPKQTEATVLSSARLHHGRGSSKKTILVVVGLLIAFLLFSSAFGLFAFFLLKNFESKPTSNSAVSSSGNNVNRSFSRLDENSLSDTEEKDKNQKARLEENSDDQIEEESLQSESTETQEDKTKYFLEEPQSETKSDERILTGKYSGSVRNQTVGGSSGLTLQLVQNGSSISGKVSIAKPAVGSGSIISGVIEGGKISFVSYNKKHDVTIYWEGELKGNSIHGTYVASTSSPYIYPNTQYGTWSVRRK